MTLWRPWHVFMMALIIAFWGDEATSQSAHSGISIQSREFLGFKGSDGAEVIVVARGELSGDLAIIVPGSGDLDIDGNGAFNMGGSIYKQIGDRLNNEYQISILRYKKIKSNIISEKYIDNIYDKKNTLNELVDFTKSKMNFDCVWLIGHSEGGVVSAMVASERNDICGIVLLAAPSIKLGEILRKQFRRPEFSASISEEADYVISSMESGVLVNEADMSPFMRLIFTKAVQKSMLSAINIDPIMYYKNVKQRALIIQGELDIQVEYEKSNDILNAIERSCLSIVPNVSHFLRNVESRNIAIQNKVNSDNNEKIDSSIIIEIGNFIDKSKKTIEC